MHRRSRGRSRVAESEGPLYSSVDEDRYAAGQMERDASCKHPVVREPRARPSLGIEGNRSCDRRQGTRWGRFCRGREGGVGFRRRRFALEDCIPVAVRVLDR